jgi:hypothetical protein
MPFSVIKPDRPVFSLAHQRRAITATLEMVADGIAQDFDKTTATWHDRPSFAVRKRGEFVREISTSHRVYAMLNEGTREHLILPRASKVLRFQTPFRAKTVPRSISSGPGSQGGDTVWSRGVHHPGTEPREWDQTIADKWSADVGRLFQRAIGEAVS